MLERMFAALPDGKPKLVGTVKYTLPPIDFDEPDDQGEPGELGGDRGDDRDLDDDQEKPR